jgi:hypothetical protein
MAQIPFTLRELKRAWTDLHAASQKLPRNNARRLLLVYAIECGLKAMWLKQENRTLFESNAIQRTGHDLNNVIKQLRLSAKLSPIFDLSDAKDERKNVIPRKSNRIDTLHQAWRYGGELLTIPVDDAAMELELEQVHQLIKKELK